MYWKENSIAISDEDTIIYIESGLLDVPKCPMKLMLTSCEAPTPKMKFERHLSLTEAKNLLMALKDAVEHQELMQQLEKSKNE